MGGRKKPFESGRERVARHIRAHRTALGLSQERLAELADVHRTYVGQVERGERNISVDNIDRFASALDIDIAELFAPS